MSAIPVHSVVKPVYRPPPAKTLVAMVPATVLTSATEETAIDQIAPIADATSSESPTNDADDSPPGTLEREHTYGDYTLCC